MSDSLNPPIPDEWLSAYLDGELSPEESARVEASAATDASVATRLQTYRDVQGMLRSMPKPAVPEGLFGPDVERSWRLNPAARKAWRAASAAAALGIASVAALIFGPQPGGEMRVARGDANAKIAAAAGSPAEAAPAPTSAPATASARPGVDGPAAVGSADVVAAEAGPAASADLPLVNLPVLGGPVVRQLPATADVPRPGELVRILERGPGGETAVIVLVVADVERTLGELRVMLQRLGVPESSLSATTTDDGAGQMVAVYVQAGTPVTQSFVSQVRSQLGPPGGLETPAAESLLAANRRQPDLLRERAAPPKLLPKASRAADLGFGAGKSAADALESSDGEVDAGYDGFDVLRDPEGSPYLQTLTVDTAAMSNILANNLAVAGPPVPKEPPRKRLLIVLRTNAEGDPSREDG